MKILERKRLNKKYKIVWSSIFFSMVILICSLSIVYSALSSTLNVSGSGTIIVTENNTYNEEPVQASYSRAITENYVPISYYYNNGYFYKDEVFASNEAAEERVKLIGSDGSDVTTLSDMINQMLDGDVLYMMNQYDMNDEALVTNVNVTIRRYSNNVTFPFISINKGECAIVVGEDGSITFDGENIETKSPAILVNENTKLDLKGSKIDASSESCNLIIKNNKSTSAAIQCSGEVNLECVKISGNTNINTFSTGAGGITVLDSPSCSLKNVIITKNIAYSNGNSGCGGFDGTSSMILLSNTVIIKDNVIYDETSGISNNGNLNISSLYSGTINASELTSGSIGITLLNLENAEENLEIATNVSEVAKMAEVFFSDNEDYEIEYKDTDLGTIEAYLKEVTKVKQ